MLEEESERFYLAHIFAKPPLFSPQITFLMIVNRWCIEFKPNPETHAYVKPTQKFPELASSHTLSWEGGCNSLSIALLLSH